MWLIQSMTLRLRPLLWLLRHHPTRQGVTSQFPFFHSRLRCFVKVHVVFVNKAAKSFHDFTVHCVEFNTVNPFYAL